LDRHLNWDGCFNVRDLGGFRVADGEETRWGAVVRSDSPDRLTAPGWAALHAHGIRTIVDLRDQVERHPRSEARGAELATVHEPVLDLGDADFWDEWRGVYDTPRFYRSVLDRWRDRFASAVAAVAHARPGGVLIHCEVGRDRTGLVAALLLSIAGVSAADIADDYELSADRLRPLYSQWLTDALDNSVRERLSRENVSDREAMLATLASLNVEDYLRAAGMGDTDLATVRARLLGHGAQRAPR
jgi:protein tyrosine/serine phosphatase